MRKGLGFCAAFLFIDDGRLSAARNFTSLTKEMKGKWKREGEKNVKLMNDLYNKGYEEADKRKYLRGKT